MRALFQGQEKKKEAEKSQPVICPVCGMTYDLHLEYCPQCNFSRPDVRNKGKIRRHKKYYALSPEGIGGGDTVRFIPR
jgi:ribosomal protein L37E